MTKPVLSYDIRTDPTPVQVKTGVTIYLVVSNPTDSYVSLSEIQFSLPLQGPNATDLSTNQSSVATTKPAGWGDPKQNGSTFTITPNNTASGTVAPAQIGGEGLVFTFGPIPVNDQPGTCELSVAEDAGNGLSEKLPFHLSKWPVEFNLSNFKATHACIQPNTPATVSWKLTGPATLTLEYNGTRHDNPATPFTTGNLGSTTFFTLTATSSYNGEPVKVALQTTVEVDVPTVLSLEAEFAVVYQDQGNSLHWSTRQTDSCVLVVAGRTIDTNAPANSPADGYPIPGNILSPVTTFQITPKKGSKSGQNQQTTTYVRKLELKSPLAGNAGWGAVAVDQIGENAYICNSATNMLDIVPLDTGKQTGSIAVGLGPRGVSISPDGKSLLVSNAFSDSISIIDIAQGVVTTTISGVDSPAGSMVLGNTAFVASAGASPKIVTLNLETRTLVSSYVVTGRPFDVALTPDGKWMYVADNAGTGVDIYDVATLKKVTTIDIGIAPTTLAASGNGASMYVGTRAGTDLFVLDAHSDPAKLTTSVPALSSPANIGVSGSGQYLVSIGPSRLFVFEFGGISLAAAALETEEDMPES